LKRKGYSYLVILLLASCQGAFADSYVTGHDIYQCAQNDVPTSLLGLTLRGRGSIELLLPVTGVYDTGSTNTLDRVTQCLLHNNLTTRKRVQQYREAVTRCRDEKYRNKVRYSQGKADSQISTPPADNLYSCLLSEAGNL